MNDQLADYGKPITLVCANCGAPLNITENTELFKCDHCNTYVLIRRIPAGPTSNVGFQSEKIISVITKNAKYYVGGSWRSGGLTLTETDLVFIPSQSFLLPKQDRLVIPITDILDVNTHGLLSQRIDIKIMSDVALNFEMIANKDFVKHLLLRLRRGL